jgi:hypothetical protein
MIPLPLIQTIYPEVDPFGSNPCEQPRMVIPKTGGLNYCSMYRSINMLELYFSRIGFAKSPYLIYSFALSESIIMSALSLILAMSLS